MVDAPEPNPAPVRVLVVDDQPPFRRAARTVVERTDGFEHVGDVGSGEAAVEFVVEHHPDLVLMDIKLPGIDGVEATRQVVGACPEVVVFLCSTYAREALPDGAMACGARAYVHKEELGSALLTRLWASLDPEHAARPQP